MFTLHHIALKVKERPSHMSSRKREYFKTYLFIYFYNRVYIMLPDGEYVLCAPGTAILYSPNEPQFWKGDGSRINHTFFDFSIDDNKYMDSFNLPYNVPLAIESSRKISMDIDRLDGYFNSTEPLTAKRIDAAMIDLFADISDGIHNHSSHSVEFVRELQERFEELRVQMYEAPERFNCDSYCQLLGFSPARALFYYKKFFCTTIQKDIDTAKKLKAQRIIRRDTKLSELCAELGFKNELYVSHWLKAQFGMGFRELKENLP